MFVPIDELVEGLIGGRAEKKVERIIAVLVFVKAHYVVGSCWVPIFPYVVVIRNLSHCLDDACNNLCKGVCFLIVFHVGVRRVDDSIHIGGEDDRSFIVAFVLWWVKVHLLTVVCHFGFLDFTFIAESLFPFSSALSFTFLTE